MLFLDDAADGAWNMAVDEALLDHVSHGGGPTLRLYRWRQPTVSLGYFQAYGDQNEHTASLGCPVVRRASGGGAIVHDQELTYGLAVPSEDRTPSASLRLYGAVHGALVTALEQFGLKAAVHREEEKNVGRPPFLCFQRRAKGDVLIGPHKIAGSAQRRRRRAVLQHGSVLFRTSRRAPRIVGLLDLASRTFSIDEFADRWLAELSVNMQMSWNVARLPKAVHAEAETLRKEKYDSTSWTERR